MEAAAAAAPSQPAAAEPPLPFLGDDIFVLIAAELDTRMLGRLGCAAQRFWRPSVPDPAHQGRAPAELWSVAEEGARRRLAAQSEQVRGWVSWGGVGGSWLRALGEAEKLQRPLRWTAHDEEVELGEEGTVATMESTGEHRSAVCGQHVMRRGRHYATFTLRGLTWPAFVGVVGAGFDPTGGDRAFASPQGWLLNTYTCWLGHSGHFSNWWEEWTRVKQGDVVGLLLDFDAATLTVWVNGERKGVMARPGMTDRIGEPVARLEGPLRWAVDLRNASVAVAGPSPLPEGAAPAAAAQ